MTESETDRGRFLAFLDGAGLRYNITGPSPSFEMLPTAELLYISYSSRVETLFLDCMFAEDGTLVGLTRGTPQERRTPCGNYCAQDPPGPLPWCGVCGRDEGSHAA